jgi:hypothetical protein
VKRRPKVYIAGPISARSGQQVRANVDRALAAGRELIGRGFAPLTPHLDYFYPDRDDVTWEQWMEIDLPWARAADAVLRLPGASRGADREVRVARRNGVPVVETIEELEELFGRRNTA